MKVETTKEKLLEAITAADRITGKNLSLDILSNVLIIAEENTLVVRSTNLDLGIEVSVPAKVSSEGAAAVPGSVVTTVLQHSREGNTVTLESKNGNISITTPQSETTIKAHPVDDFPTLPKVTGVDFSLDAHELVRGLRSVWYSASTSTIKPELGSVYIYQEDGKLFFVATDSFRLAEKKVQLKRSVADFDPILIPFKNVPEIIRNVESAEESVDVVVGENQLSITVGGVYLTSRLVDGTFPDYQQIVPKEFSTEVVVLKHDIATALKRAGVFTDTFGQVGFLVQPSKKTFTISSSNPDVGETSERINAAVSGEDIEINFNIKYITDCFQSITTDSVTFSFSGLSKPLVISGVGDGLFFYLVMPMNR